MRQTLVICMLRSSSLTFQALRSTHRRFEQHGYIVHELFKRIRLFAIPQVVTDLEILDTTRLITDMETVSFYSSPIAWYLTELGREDLAHLVTGTGFGAASYTTSDTTTTQKDGSIHDASKNMQPKEDPTGVACRLTSELFTTGRLR